VNPKPPRQRLHPALKALVAVVILAVVGYLFVRSATSTRGEPYEIQAAHLTGWSLAADSAQDAEDAAISLRPPAELPLNLFRQLFRRQMESLSTPESCWRAATKCGPVSASISYSRWRASQD
jgi:hypothetical protein